MPVGCASGRYVYNYFRDYDPSLGRYLQSDPIGLRGGANTFSYARSNPVSMIDVLGLDSFCPNPGTERSQQYKDAVGLAKDVSTNTLDVLTDQLLSVPKTTTAGGPLGNMLEVLYQGTKPTQNSGDIFGSFVGNAAGTVTGIISSNPLIDIGVSEAVSSQMSNVYNNHLTPQRTEDFWRNYTPPNARGSQ